MKTKVAGASLVAAALLAASGAHSMVPGSTALARTSNASARELTIAQGVDPLTLDAGRSTVQQSLNVSTEIEEPLFDLNYTTHKVTPRLGLAVKRKGTTVWEVRLRHGVKFTNGEPFNAAAVKYSILRINNPALKSPATIYTAPIKSIRTPNSTTVDIVTKAPSPVIPLYLTRLYMVPPKYIARVGDNAFGQQPVGTGPYKFSQWVHDDHVTLVANTHYWGTKPTFSKVVFRSIPQDATRMAALQSGQVNLATDVPVVQAPALKSAGLNIITKPGLRLMMAQFNLLQQSAVSDKRVRQALNYAVNKTALIKQILKGYGKALPGQPLTKDYFGYNSKVKAYPYNPSKARQLLKAAGYGPSHPLAVTLYGPQGRYVDDKEIVQAIAGQLQAVGVNASPQIETWDLYLPQLLSKKLGPMAFWGASTVPDADIWLGAMMTSKGAYSTWSDPKFDKLVQQGGSTLSPSKRRAIYAKAMVYAHDQAPLLYLYQQVDIYGASPKLSNFHASPDEYIGLAGVHLK